MLNFFYYRVKIEHGIALTSFWDTVFPCIFHACSWKPQVALLKVFILDILCEHPFQCVWSCLLSLDVWVNLFYHTKVHSSSSQQVTSLGWGFFYRVRGFNVTPLPSSIKIDVLSLLSTLYPKPCIIYGYRLYSLYLSFITLSFFVIFTTKKEIVNWYPLFCLTHIHISLYFYHDLLRL